MAKKLPNILFFGIDSIRSDHMSCYGYPRQTTPHFDKLAEESVLFENNFSPVVPTTPAYTAMLSGMDQFTTRVVSLSHAGDDKSGKLATNFQLLPEILGELGYHSVCIGFDGGFYRGFDEYVGYSSWGPDESGFSRKAESLNSVAMPKMEELAAQDKPWMLFLRHMDPHTPYLPPAPFNRLFYTGDECAPGNNSMQPVWDFKPFADYFRSWLPDGITDIEYVNASYDGALAYMDACCQQLLNRLDELGLEEETIVIVNGDHGETLDEHECFFDHHGLYEPTLVVPLIMRYPGVLPEGVRVPGYTKHVDLVPTIMELLEVDTGIEFDGKSQMPLIYDEVPTNYTEFYIAECTWMRKHGWRTTEWKFFESLEPDFHNKPPVELYNLISDPLELCNLADKEPGLVEELRRRMNAFLTKREEETGKKPPIYDYRIGTEKSIGSISTANKLQSHKDEEEEDR